MQSQHAAHRWTDSFGWDEGLARAVSCASDARVYSSVELHRPPAGLSLHAVEQRPRLAWKELSRQLWRKGDFGFRAAPPPSAPLRHSKDKRRACACVCVCVSGEGE